MVSKHILNLLKTGLISIAVFVIFYLGTSATIALSTTGNCNDHSLGKYCAVGATCSCNCGVPNNTPPASSIWKVNGNEPTNCASGNENFNGYGVEDQHRALPGDPGCTTSLQTLTLGYCPNNRAFQANNSGDLIMYTSTTYYSISINGHTPVEGITPNGNMMSKIDTGLVVNSGDWITIKIGAGLDANANPTANHYEFLGWRDFDGYTRADYYDSIRDDITTNHYSIISNQIWSDGPTDSIYDSYDFDDASVIFVVKGAPVCNPESDINLNVTPQDSQLLYLSEHASFNYTYNSPNGAIFKFKSNTFNPNISISGCNPGNSNPAICKLDDRKTYNYIDPGKYNTDITWTMEYQNCVSNSGPCSTTCTATHQFTIFPYPTYINTVGGTAFVGKKIIQPKQIGYFTTGLLSSYLPNTINNFTSGRLSSNFIAVPYTDSNNHSDYPSWYTNGILNDPRYTPITIPHDLELNSNTDFQTYTTNSTTINIIHIQGSLDFNVGGIFQCNNANIFIIDNDLTFNSPLQIQQNNKANSGCLFIVGGTLTFKQKSDIDTYEGFFITNKLNSTNNSGQLIITGGIIQQGTNQITTLGRNINDTVTIAGGIHNDPSEQINYEGARYIKLFGDVLKEPVKLTIRELPYIKVQ